MSNNIYKALALTLIMGAGYLQSAAQVKVSVNANNQPIEKVLDQIGKSSGYEIFYVDGHLDDLGNVTVKATNEDLKSVLDRIFAGKDVTRTIRDRQVIITRRKKKDNRPGKSAGRKENRTAGAATVTRLTGTVTGTDGEPLIGATVFEKGTQNGVVTDVDGNFEINVHKPDATLAVSYVGYDGISVKATPGKAMKITMRENSELLNEVVVVGYGTMKKSDLTGSVSQIKIDETRAATVSSVTNALAGKAAGMQVSLSTSQPGAASTIRIRGAASPNTDNSPLIVIDGFPVNPTSDGKTAVGKYNSGQNDNFLGSINPNDIESIEVLKDASSTAIYGSRAGHGVILITTKKGKAGRATVTYTGNVSAQVMAKGYDMLDARNYMIQTERYRMEKWRIDNGVGFFGGKDEEATMQTNPYTPKYTQDMIANPGETTDWFGAVTRTGFQTAHNLNVQGGAENTRYLVSGNFMMQNGLVKNNDMKRFTLRSNITQKFNEHFSGGIYLTFSRIDQNSIPSGLSSNEDSGVMVAAASQSPLQPIYDENGNYTTNPLAAYLPNPVSMLDITNKSRRNRFLGSTYVEYKPIKELTFKLNLGIDYNNHKRQVYMPKTTLYGQKVDGQADIAQYDQNDYLAELTASYVKDFSDIHSINAVIGASYQKFNSEGFTAGNSGFLSDALLYNNLSYGDYAKPWVSSSKQNSEMASFFGRINYSLMNRYLLTATIRADGSSNFAKGHQWGYFPSVALGWRFSEENFMDRARSWFSNGKLRLSWGQTGNSSIGYQAVSMYRGANSGGTKMNHGFGGVEHLGFIISQLGNPDITWETTTEFNVGLDLGFINNRINLTVDYFNREISNLLNWRTLACISPVSGIADNMGKTRSQGLEITLNTINIDNRDFSWTTDLTFSFYRDRWEERAENWTPSVYSRYKGAVRPLEGYFLTDGLVQPGEEIPSMPGAIPGQIKIRDINGYVFNADGTYKTDEHGIPVLTGQPDGKIDDADRVYMGSRDPGFIMGFNNTLRYKNFDFNIYFYGHFNQWTTGAYRDLWIQNAYIVDENKNVPVSIEEMWSTDNPDGWRPGFAQSSNSIHMGSTDFYLKKCWFIRCRNITLGYSIPVKKGISKLRVYADVNNPFMLTNYKGLDMETDDSAYAIPNVRSFNFGVEISF